MFFIMTTKTVYFCFWVKQKNEKFFVFLFYWNAESCVVGLARGKFFANKKCAKRRDFGMKTPEFLENLRGFGEG